jgi:hypothetical protein
MPFLVIALLSILAGTLLLAKFRKDMPGKFFSFIAWFFIVVGFLLFIGFIAGGICKMKHHCSGDYSGCKNEMMMKGCNHGMMMKGCSHGENAGGCRTEGMGRGMCPKHEGCMQHDSAMKCCPKHMKCDSAKMTPPPK